MKVGLINYEDRAENARKQLSINNNHIQFGLTVKFANATNYEKDEV